MRHIVWVLRYITVLLGRRGELHVYDGYRLGTNQRYMYVAPWFHRILFVSFPANFSQLVIFWKVENKSQHKYIRYSVKKHSIKLIKCILILACMSITPYVTFLLWVCSIPGCVYGNYNINTVCHTLPYVC